MTSFYEALSLKSKALGLHRDLPPQLPPLPAFFSALTFYVRFVLQFSVLPGAGHRVRFHWLPPDDPITTPSTKTVPVQWACGGQ